MKSGIKITIPSQFRKNLSKNLVIARGINICLFLYGEKSWKKVKNELEKYAEKSTSRDTLRFINLFLSGSEKIKMSKDGKITISSYMADYANLKKNIVLIDFGPRTRLSIWDKEEFRKYKDKAKNKISKNILKHISLV